MDAAWIALALSLKVALWATGIALVLGVAAGLALARGRFPGRDLLDALLLLPMVLPPTVLGYYLLVLVGRRGWLGGWLDRTFGIQLVFTWQGAVIAAALVAVPVRLQIGTGGVRGGRRRVRDGGAHAGAGPPSRCSCASPCRWPGAASSPASLLAFARALGEFGATLMIAGSIAGQTQTLSIAVYEAVQAGQDELANALVLLTSVSCVAVLLLAGRLAPRRIAVPR